ncbi:TIGR04211 family SH3 domain-containing protein [Ferrimonas pelagia]|uniref:TIGR04211 family SH3 domain-containing protein n=1 Tax=Ferrimonas pelagia TaxID=1177826 RepID=A0ABP9FDC0_9GAMM
MLKRITTLLLCLSAFSIQSFAQEAKHSVSEDVYIYLQAGPSTQFRILGSVKAGEGLTSLNESSGDFSKVRDSQGRTGWIRSEFLSAGPSFRTQVPKLETALADTRAQLAKITAERDELAGASSQQQEANISQQRQLESVTSENERLKAQVSTLQNNERFIWLKQGGAIGGVGLVLGLILAYLPRPKRRKKNDHWM